MPLTIKGNSIFFFFNLDLKINQLDGAHAPSAEASSAEYPSEG